MEVREFDWDSSRKGASQLSRTKTIRLSTPKTTTGEILIFALTSPLNFGDFGRETRHVKLDNTEKALEYALYVGTGNTGHLILHYT